MTVRSPEWSQDALIAEVEFFLPDFGPEEIATRLRTTVSAIKRAAYRAGRPDLARPFGRALNAQMRQARRNLAASIP